MLAADVAGYSRPMGTDEEGTLARLKAVRRALVDPALAAHRGRIVKTTGDGMLVEFASAVDAARCAIEVQRAMAAQNGDRPHDISIEFRIGIHVGDIIIDDNDIFGDGVNIAARLEGIASRAVFACPTTLIVKFGIMLSCLRRPGGAALKNIAVPMRVVALAGAKQRATNVLHPAARAGAPRQALYRGTALPEHESGDRSKNISPTEWSKTS